MTLVQIRFKYHIHSNLLPETIYTTTPLPQTNHPLMWSYSHSKDSQYRLMLWYWWSSIPDNMSNSSSSTWSSSWALFIMINKKKIDSAYHPNHLSDHHLHTFSSFFSWYHIICVLWFHQSHQAFLLRKGISTLSSQSMLDLINILFSSFWAKIKISWW